MLKWLIQPFHGFAKTYKIKGEKTVPDTLFQSTNYSHSPFLMVFCSVETSRGKFTGKKSLSTARQTFPSATVQQRKNIRSPAL